MMVLAFNSNRQMSEVRNEVTKKYCAKFVSGLLHAFDHKCTHKNLPFTNNINMFFCLIKNKNKLIKKQTDWCGENHSIAVGKKKKKRKKSTIRTNNLSIRSHDLLDLAMFTIPNTAKDIIDD